MQPIVRNSEPRRCRCSGSAGGEGGLRPDFATLGAIDDCNKGNTAAGIAVLEKKLRSNGFTLPKR